LQTFNLYDVGGSYVIYTYCGIDRELRNLLLKITIGIASSWFVFFLCRSFERFCRDWVWVPMSVCLAQLLDLHLNPLSRDEVVVSTLLISLGVSLSFPRIFRAAQSKFTKGGAGFMTPRLRIWANKVGVKVNHFREKLNRRRQYGADDASVPDSEFVSLSLSSIKSSMTCEEVDDNTPNTYATPRGYISGFDDDDNDDEEGEDFEEDIAYGYTNDEHFEEISIRRAASNDKLVQNRIESMKGSDMGHSVYPNNPKQLWEILNPNLDGYDGIPPSDTPFDHPPSDTPFDPALASHGSILNLFLGNSEEDNDVDGDIKEDIMRALVEGEMKEVLDEDNVEIRSHTEDKSFINSRGNEAMSYKNRCALSRAVGISLTVLDLFSFIRQEEDLDANQELSTIKSIADTLEEEPGVGGVRTHFTHVVGAMSMRISALGPLILDRCSVYVPIGSNESSLLKPLQMGLNIVSASNCRSSIFPPKSEYHHSSAILTTSTFADALLVQRWIMNAINLPLLRSIAMDRDIKVPQGDFVLSASARFVIIYWSFISCFY
jgi:hypothetical protein